MTGEAVPTDQSIARTPKGPLITADTRTVQGAPGRGLRRNYRTDALNPKSHTAQL
jgi:hypothetical protein